LAEAMIITAADCPSNENEVPTHASLETSPSIDVRPPKLQRHLSQWNEVTQIVLLKGTNVMVLGRVVRFTL
jgi:hypothetical protein